VVSKSLQAQYPDQCNLYVLRFTHKGNLKRHWETPDNDCKIDRWLPLECRVCSKRFAKDQVRLLELLKGTRTGLEKVFFIVVYCSLFFLFRVGVLPRSSRHTLSDKSEKERVMN